jgi:hypothetical protein
VGIPTGPSDPAPSRTAHGTRHTAAQHGAASNSNSGIIDNINSFAEQFYNDVLIAYNFFYILTTRLLSSGMTSKEIPAHSCFDFDEVTFSSNFDSGNLARVDRLNGKPYDFKIWIAPDNMGTPHQSKHCAWFHFQVTGIPMGSTLRIQIANASNHSSLYKFDMVRIYEYHNSYQK